MSTLHIYWSRRDIRLHDNPALSAAIQASQQDHGYFLPVFVLEKYMTAGQPKFQFGWPQRQFLAKALPDFAANFSAFALVHGQGAHCIWQLCQLGKAHGYTVKVHVNDDVYPDFYKQVNSLKQLGADLHVYPDQLTVSTKTRTGNGDIYSVFTPFKKAVWSEFLNAQVLPKAKLDKVRYAPEPFLHKLPERLPLTETGLHKVFATSRTLVVGDNQQHVFDLDELLPEPPNLKNWYTHETQAQKHFLAYRKTKLDNYTETRDSLALDATSSGTSKMSLALTWGLVSARWLRQHVLDQAATDFQKLNWLNVPKGAQGQAQYLSELVWREFYKYLLYHYPKLRHTEFQERYRGTLKWVSESLALERFTAWITGRTGYPIVDAAMMQLAKTGWMHNRSRMIVASVLTKNLGVDWRWGQEYFRAQLIDLDEASNNGGWQWGASVGADPKPIRIFNPYLQAKAYDPDGDYQRLWLGKARLTEPALEPLVPHDQARREALKRYGVSRTQSLRRD